MSAPVDVEAVVRTLNRKARLAFFSERRRGMREGDAYELAAQVHLSQNSFNQARIGSPPTCPHTWRSTYGKNIHRCVECARWWTSAVSP